MAMPKSTQTRFVGIRDNHNHYTSLRLLFLIIIIIILLLMSTHAILRVFLTCMWEKLIFSLSIIFILLLTIQDPHATQKTSVGIIVVVIISYPLKSCLCAFWHCHPYFIFKFYLIIFYTCYIYVTSRPSQSLPTL